MSFKKVQKYKKHLIHKYKKHGSYQRPHSIMGQSAASDANKHKDIAKYIAQRQNILRPHSIMEQSAASDANKHKDSGKIRRSWMPSKIFPPWAFWRILNQIIISKMWKIQIHKYKQRCTKSRDNRFEANAMSNSKATSSLSLPNNEVKDILFSDVLLLVGALFGGLLWTNLLSVYPLIGGQRSFGQGWNGHGWLNLLCSFER